MKDKYYIFHRGYHNHKIMENSKKSFTKVVDFHLLKPHLNIGVEFDIRLTRDNQYVVLHDENLNRLFNINKKVSELSLNQLKFISNQILSLDEACKIFEHLDILIDIEIKSHHNLQLELLKKYFNKKFIVFSTFDKNIYKKLNCKNKIKLSNFSIFSKSIINHKYHWINFNKFGCYTINNYQDFYKINKKNYKFIICDNLQDYI